MKFVLLVNLKLLTIANYFLLNIAEHEHSSANKKIMLYNFGTRSKGTNYDYWSSVSIVSHPKPDAKISDITACRRWCILLMYSAGRPMK